MKYLLSYAEREAREAPNIVGGQWDETVVVPVLRESALLEGLLESLETAASKSQKRVLAIFIVNCRATAPPRDREDNLVVLRKAEARQLSPGLSLSGRGLLNCLWVDRSSIGREFGDTDGVGTARKIGCDIALALKEANQINSEWVSTTDGDARIEPSYFSDLNEGPSAGLGNQLVGSLYRFRHDVSEDPKHLSLTLYETYLRHYVLGLRAAGSPYAFHTIGSLIRVRLISYGEIRGFPRRDAGEDFYLLDKLAKIGKLGQHPALVRLIPRPSDRVPFGTGAAMTRLENELRMGKIFELFPDSAFRALGLLQRMIGEKEARASCSGWKTAFLSQGMSEHALTCLDRLGFFKMVKEAHATRRDGNNFRRHVQTSFGSLKTFQWIRAISAKEGGLNYREGLRRCEFLGIPVGEKETPFSLLEKVRLADEAQPAAETFF